MSVLTLDSATPFCPRRMLMGTDNPTINGHPFKVGVGGDRVGYPLPNAFLRPAREAHVGRVPPPIFVRQISPGSARTHDPQDRFQKLAVVCCRDATVGRFPRQQIFQLGPLVVPQQRSRYLASCTRQGS